jgi:hypothetical protein
MAFLFTNQTTDGTSSDLSFGFPCTVYASGVFAGANVKILISAPGGEFVPVINWRPQVGSINTPDAFVVEPVGSYELRAVLSGANSSTDVTIEVIEG